MSEQIYIGIDLGGTAIKVGICNSEGKLLHTYEGATGTEHGAEAVLDNIAKYSRLIVDQSPYSWEQVAGVGAGLAGFLDIRNGIVKLSPNLNWENVPAKQILEQKLGKPVSIDNDAMWRHWGRPGAVQERGFPPGLLYLERE